MASLTHAPGKKRWLPLAIAAIVAGVVVYSVLDRPEETVTPPSSAVTDAPSQAYLDRARNQSGEGRYQAALATLDEMPDADASMDAELLRATILLQSGQTREAETLLIELREQYPTRPEPLNNLAVIYAESGDTGRAIETLQLAFSTHSSYAKVYQNLSDMYAVLAAEAYNKALGLPKSNSGAQLTMIDQFGEQTAPVAETVLAQDTAPPAPVVADNSATAQTNEAPTEQPAAQADNSPAVAAQTSTPDLSDTKLPYTNVVMNQADSDAIVAAQTSNEDPAAAPSNNALDPEVFRTTPQEQAIVRDTQRAEELLASLNTGTAPAADSTLSDVAPLPLETNPAPEATPEDAVKQHLTQWAQAWSAQSVDDYVRAYVDNYQPNRNTSHQQWLKQRTDRLTKPSFIKVSLRDIKVRMISDTRAEATFRQVYRSDRYRDSERKKVRLIQRATGWKILQEGKQ